MSRVKTVRSASARASRAWSWSNLWRSQRVRGQCYQWASVLALVALCLYMGNNAVQALAARGMKMSLGFLWDPAGFTLAESVLPFQATDTYFYAFVAGLSNTLWVSLVSLVLASLFGVLLGVARLSSNYLLARLAAAYIEVFRNTPQLIQIVFWYTLFTLLPSARQAWHAGELLYLSNRGLVAAWPVDRWVLGVLLLALVAGLWAAGHIRRWLSRRYALPIRGFSWASIPGLLVYMAFLVALWWWLGQSDAWQVPRLQGFNFRGGLTLSPEFLAIALGLILYFSAYIAEIVRSGIQSVGRGQVEAARALNIHGRRLYRHIILPQALRVIVPPVSAQYISLIKTSALGVAVGYPELFNVSNSVMTLSGHTLECVFIMGAVYLLMAVSMSSVMNVFNRRVALRGGTR